jgi:hypothetical protein
MATDDIKQNATEEGEPENEAELDKENLEGIGGGIGIGPFKELIQRPVPEQPDEHKDGGATGSW